MDRLIMTVIISYVGLPTATVGEDFCLRESVNVSCSSEEVVLITSAQYGRMRGGRCIRGDVGATGCSSDVLPQLDEVCSGRQRCVFPVANLLQHKPCPDDYTPFLETHHTCLRVSQSRCVNSDGLILLTDQDGFIPLSVHSSKCPWRIKVDHLQTLQFTLFSFGQRRIPSECPWSVVFNDGGKTMEHPLCHIASRETALYTSRSSSVTVRVSYKENIVLPVPYFLKYEAVGCPQLKVPGYAWVRQDESRATVKCNQTEETWFLACSDRQWHGEIGNCSRSVPSEFAPGSSMSNVSKVTSLPFGFMIAVVIGVLLGIVIGAIPLALVYVCLKRKWRRQPPSYFVTEDPYYPGMQHTFVESQQTNSIYPALLKRSAVHGPTSSSSPKNDTSAPRTGASGQCCYGCAESFVYNTITTATNTATNQFKEKQTADDKNCRQTIECRRVLECPDVMAHVVTIHGAGGGGGPSLQQPSTELVKPMLIGHNHHYESAAYCRTSTGGGGGQLETDPGAGDFAPSRCYDSGDGVHCSTRAAKLDLQVKRNSEDLTELRDEYRNPSVQAL